MENATKALLIGGGILIGILILTIFAYMFSNIGAISDIYLETQEEQDLDVFNSKFNIYTNRDLKIQDVITLNNLVKDYNSDKAEKNAERITIKINTRKNIDLNDLNATVPQYSEKIFICKLEYKNGRVKTVIIEEK